MPGNIKAQKAIIKEWAKANMVGNNYSSPVGLINITLAGIKEALNQPHRHPVEKLESNYRVENLLAEAEFIKMSADKKDRPLNWYYLKIIIAGSNSYIVIREDTYLRTKIFYSIVDNIK